MGDTYKVTILAWNTMNNHEILGYSNLRQTHMVGFPGKPIPMEHHHF